MRGDDGTRIVGGEHVHLDTALADDIGHLVAASLVADGQQRGREVGAGAELGLNELGEALERTTGTAALADWRKRTVVVHREHGLDVEHGAHEALGARAAAVLNDVLERVEGEDEVGLLPQLLKMGKRGLKRLAGVAHAAGLLDEHAVHHRGRARVPDVHLDRGILGGEVGGVGRTGERRGDVDGEDALGTGSGHPGVGLAKARGRRLRAVRQLLGGGHAVIELLGLHLDLVEVAGVPHEDVQRHHLDAELVKLVERQVTGAVGEDLEVVLHGSLPSLLGDSRTNGPACARALVQNARPRT